MGVYTQLIASKGVARVMGSQLLARFPYGLMSISFALHFYNLYHSYSIVGLAIGAETIGVGISGPWLGRKLAHWGMRRTLLGGATIFALCLIILAIFELDAWLAITLAAICGLASPPIQSAARACFDELVDASQIKALFSFDSISQELIWIIGPVVAAFLATLFSPVAAIWLMVASTVGGTIWFLSNPEVKRVKLEDPQQKIGGVLKNRSVIVLIAIGSLLVAGFSGVEIGTIGTLDTASAGLVISALSVGSMIGGLIMGHRAKRRGALAKYSALIFAGYLLALIAPTNPGWLAFCWFLAGFGVAPALGLISMLINQVLSKTASVEAYGWLGTGQLLGYSGAAALSGFAIDTIAPTAPFGLGALIGLLTTVVALLSISLLPKLVSDAE